MEDTELRAKIRSIMQDASLSDAQKAEARQKLLTGNTAPSPETASQSDANGVSKGAITCPICLSICERPVTAPCQHSLCLLCFKRWTGKGNETCPTCRKPYLKEFANNPRVNTLLVAAIRWAKAEETKPKQRDAKPFVRMDNDTRPEKAFITERAQRKGRANAASGRIMVNVPNDWFGPILPEHDPENHRIEWTVASMEHISHMSLGSLVKRIEAANLRISVRIANGPCLGAQSVVLSGGYEDDLDNGDWFLYTGSGGRDLSGNRRTNKHHSSDQVFKSSNEALRVSCIYGLPIRVVRSHKEKRSFYAPPVQMPVRYDGIYRILKCWRIPGKQGFLICRYLFVRCDNAPAPWSSTGDSSARTDCGKLDLETGDEVNLEVPENAAREIEEAVGKVYQMTSTTPYWDFNKDTGMWGFVREQPPHAAPKEPRPRKPQDPKKKLKKFKCRLCDGVLKSPVSTPCGHNFCKACLESKFSSMEDVINRTETTGRTLRDKKVVKPCPACQTDIAGFLKTAPVNRELEELIQKLQQPQEKSAEQEKPSETEVIPSENESQTEARSEEAPKVPSTEGQSEKTAKAEDSVQLQLETLSLDFPEFDKDLIKGLMQDQGNDTDEVISYLEKLRKDNKDTKSRPKRARSPDEAYIDSKKVKEDAETEDDNA